MGRALARLAIVAISASFACGCTTTFPGISAIPTAPSSVLTPPVASTIPNSYVAAVIPPGFVSFCLRFADQCKTQQNAAAKIVMTDAAWRTIEYVNSAVNSAIWSEDDQAHYGRAEYWTIPTDGYGDCEDYALTKRKDLIDAGFPEPALRIAIAVTPREARHAVLTVATDKGDFVLDNLRNDILAWNATGYTWIERQDPARPMGWVSLQPPVRTIAANDASGPPVAGGNGGATAALAQPVSSMSKTSNK